MAERFYKIELNNASLNLNNFFRKIIITIMGLQGVFSKLERAGFLLFHKVVDTDFIDEIENIIPETFSSDLYGIIYYTYDDFEMGCKSGYMRLHFSELEDNGSSLLIYMKEVLINNQINFELVKNNTFFIELNNKDIEYLNNTGKIMKKSNESNRRILSVIN